MAIICRDHRLLFIMTPRTGCTAIGELLAEKLGGEYLPEADVVDERGMIAVPQKHTTLRQLLEHGILSEDERRRVLVFTCVRNPFDSLVSLYVKKAITYQSLLGDPSAFIHRVPGYVEDMAWCRSHSFDEWVERHYAPSILDRMLRRKRRSMFGKFTDGVDVVMQFERLQADFDSVLAQVGLAPMTIPTINPTPERDADYRRYYSSRSRRIVEYLSREDNNRYGYRF
jgi:hypothetical protein